MKSISELLDSLSAKQTDTTLNPTGVVNPSGNGAGSNNNSFGQVIAKISNQQQNANNNNPVPLTANHSATTPVVSPSAVTPATSTAQTPSLLTGSTGANQAAQDTLLVIEKLQGVKPQDVAAIEKAFFAMASGLANLLSQAQQLTGENSSQLQAQLVANSGGQITPAEASQLVSAVQTFVQNLPQGQNPLDLNKQDQNQLVGQMLQQMLQNQQVAFALAPQAATQGDNQSVNTTSSISSIAQSNVLSNVTLRFMFADGQISQTSATGNQNSGVQVNFQSAGVQVLTQTFNTQNSLGSIGSDSLPQASLHSNQPILNRTVNFQPISQDTVNSILNTLSQLGAQQTTNLPVTIVNPTVLGQGQQNAANGQNLQALFKVLLQAGAGPVMLQSSMAQQGTTANNPNSQATTQTGNLFTQFSETITGSIQSVSVQPIASAQNTENPTINQNSFPSALISQNAGNTPVNLKPIPQTSTQPTGNISNNSNLLPQNGAQTPENLAVSPKAVTSTQGNNQTLQPQNQTAANAPNVGNAQSFWSSVNFRRINDLVLRFTNFIGQSNTAVAVQSAAGQGPAPVAIANTPSAITAQVGSSVGPQASPIAIAQLPNGDQQEIVNNVLTPNTIQIQPIPIPNAPVTTTTRIQTQDQIHLSQSQLSQQDASVLNQNQTPISPLASNPIQSESNQNSQNSTQTQVISSVSPLIPTNTTVNSATPLNNNPAVVTSFGTSNSVASSANINPAPPSAVSGPPVLPGTQVVTLSQPVPQSNSTQPSQGGSIALTSNALNQAQDPGLSTPPVSLAQNLSGSVAAVNLFAQGIPQNQSNHTQTPITANPVQPSGTISTATPQAVSAVTNVGASENLKPIGAQEKSPLTDLMSSQNQPALASNGVVYTLGKNGELQSINPAGNQVPVNVQDLIRQISNQISGKTGDLKATSTISFQLSPENLGRMTIQVSMADQSVSARILVTNSDVRDALQQHLVDLKTSLSQSGLQIDQLQVQVQGGGASLLAQYYQYQQEGYGASLPFMGDTSSTEIAGENEANLAPLSLRKSLVNLLA